VILQLVYGLAIIAGLMAVQAAALYAIGWLVLLIFRYVPLVGKKHRHEHWQRLNGPPE
jgi:hypothetical protein